ncbi:MAG: transcription termination/antitermination protein NusA, partial [Firmicutes bacterium]|nr:transcription termination/antitermination protein NusA [Bacillota bacterium]
MNLELIGALKDLEKERGISKDVLIEAIETAIVSAYKRNFNLSSNASVRVDLDETTGAINVYSRRKVVDDVTDPKQEISLEEAKAIDPNYTIGDIVEEEVTPKDFGRIAAQTAKQVVIQRIREAERSIIFNEYANRAGDVVNGIIQRIDHRNVIIDLGKVEAVLPVSEQIPGERYEPNQRMKFYINEVKQSSRGPQIFLSRTHPGLLKYLFELEVPEIQSGVVEIKSVAREAGSRSKIAVFSRDENVDPVGACVGSKGMRVQAVVSQLNGEKIDIVAWVPDEVQFIANALSPAAVIR